MTDAARTRHGRRAFLRGAGSVAIALPWLEALGCGWLTSDRSGPRRASTVARRSSLDAPPKRFVTLFSGNGTIYDAWRPSGAETAFTLSEILSPLEAHKADIVVLDGLTVESSNHGPGEEHMKGMAGFLTSTELLEGDLFVDSSDLPAGWGGGISLDQEIANHVGTTTPFKSLELGVQIYDNDVWSRMSYTGPAEPLPPMDDPRAVFDRIFAGFTAGGGSVDTTELDRIRRRRLSVLDSAQAEIVALEGKLGADDRVRLDAHLTAIRDLEMRLSGAGAVGGASCTPPVRETDGLDVYENDNFPAVSRLQIDLMVMALACGLTRVASLMWSYSRSHTHFNWLGVGTDSHHTLSHEANADTSARDALVLVNQFYAGETAYLLDRLAAVTEADGTLLDHTLVLWGNELGNGDDHDHDNTPFVLAGRAGGALRTGRFLTYPGVSHGNLCVSMLNAMDIAATSFGNPAYASGPLAGLLG